MKISDKDFDKLISVAISQVPDDDDIELKTDDELRSEGSSMYEFSPAFEKRMKKLIRESQKQQSTTYRAKGFRSKIRVAILVAVLVCAATMFSVSAFRTSIANFFFDSEGKSSTISIDSGEKPVLTEFEKYLPNYSPNGFAVNTVQKIADGGVFIQFSNGQDIYYDVQYTPKVMSAFVDTEDGEVSELKINNADVVISERQDRIMATYTRDGSFYLISGNIPYDEIINILESIPSI